LQFLLFLLHCDVNCNNIYNTCVYADILFIYLFIYLCIYLFIHSSIHSFIHSFFHSCFLFFLFLSFFLSFFVFGSHPDLDLDLGFFEEIFTIVG